MVGEGTKLYLSIPKIAGDGTKCSNIHLKLNPVLQHFGALLHLPMLELLPHGVWLTT
ncbi:hypothetical protein MKX03_013862, partial [Papaver bracteatum]